jgi:hypothetical protein
MTQGRLQIWTVYEKPKDFPHCFVARMFEGDEATDEIMVCSDLEPIRQELAKRGLVCLPRDENDDPVIVESWL